MDIYQSVPSEFFENIVASIRIGNEFCMQIQGQHGFMRGAVFTLTSARWISPVLVNDQKNFEMLFSLMTEEILEKSRGIKPKLSVVKDNNTSIP